MSARAHLILQPVKRVASATPDREFAGRARSSRRLMLAPNVPLALPRETRLDAIREPLTRLARAGDSRDLERRTGRVLSKCGPGDQTPAGARCSRCDCDPAAGARATRTCEQVSAPGAGARRRVARGRGAELY